MLRYLLGLIVFTMITYFVIDLAIMESIQISIMVAIMMILIGLFEKRKNKTEN